VRHLWLDIMNEGVWRWIFERMALTWMGLTWSQTGKLAVVSSSDAEKDDLDWACGFGLSFDGCEGVARATGFTIELSCRT
jgi:hypothetical protein